MKDNLEKSIVLTSNTSLSLLNEQVVNDTFLYKYNFEVKENDEIINYTIYSEMSINDIENIPLESVNAHILDKLSKNNDNIYIGKIYINDNSELMISYKSDIISYLNGNLEFDISPESELTDEQTQASSGSYSKSGGKIEETGNGLGIIFCDTNKLSLFWEELEKLSSKNSAENIDSTIQKTIVNAQNICSTKMFSSSSNAVISKIGAKLGGFGGCGGGQSISSLVSVLLEQSKIISDMLLENKQQELKDNESLSRSILGGLLSDFEYKKAYQDAINNLRSKGNYTLGDVLGAFQTIEQKDFNISDSDVSDHVWDVLSEKYLNMSNEESVDYVKKLLKDTGALDAAQLYDLITNIDKFSSEDMRAMSYDEYFSDEAQQKILMDIYSSQEGKKFLTNVMSDYYTTEEGQEYLRSRFAYNSITGTGYYDDSLINTAYVEYCIDQNKDSWLPKELRKTVGALRFIKSDDFCYKDGKYTSVGQQVLFFMDTELNDGEKWDTAFSDKARATGIYNNDKLQYMSTHSSLNGVSAEEQWLILEGELEDKNGVLDTLKKNGELSYSERCNNRAALNKLAEVLDIDGASDKNLEDLLKDIENKSGLTIDDLSNEDMILSAVKEQKLEKLTDLEKEAIKSISATMRVIGTPYGFGNESVVLGLKLVEGVSKFGENVFDAFTTLFNSGIGIHALNFDELGEIRDITDQYQQEYLDAWYKHVNELAYLKDDWLNSDEGKKYCQSTATQLHNMATDDIVKSQAWNQYLKEKFNYNGIGISDRSVSSVYIAALKDGILGDESNYKIITNNKDAMKIAKKQFNAMEKVAVNHVGNAFSLLYDTSLYEQIEGLSLVKKDGVIAQTVEQIGTMAIPIALNFVPGVGPGLSRLLSSAALGFSAGGGAAEEAFISGAGYNQAITYGAVSAATEMVVEQLFSGIGGYGKGLYDESLGKVISKIGDFATSKSPTLAKLATDLSDNLIFKTGVELTKKGIGEGIEEVFTDLVTPISQYLIYQADLTDQTMVEYWDEQVSIEGLCHTFIVSALSGAVFGTIDVKMQTNTFNQNLAILDSMIAEYPQLQEYRDRVFAELIGTEINDDSYRTLNLIDSIVNKISSDMANNENAVSELNALKDNLSAKLENFKNTDVEINVDGKEVIISQESLINAANKVMSKKNGRTTFSKYLTEIDGKITIDESMQSKFATELYKYLKSNEVLLTELSYKIDDSDLKIKVEEAIKSCENATQTNFDGIDKLFDLNINELIEEYNKVKIDPQIIEEKINNTINNATENLNGDSIRSLLNSHQNVINSSQKNRLINVLRAVVNFNIENELTIAKHKDEMKNLTQKHQQKLAEVDIKIEEAINQNLSIEELNAKKEALIEEMNQKLDEKINSGLKDIEANVDAKEQELIDTLVEEENAIKNEYQNKINNIDKVISEKEVNTNENIEGSKELLSKLEQEKQTIIEENIIEKNDLIKEQENKRNEIVERNALLLSQAASVATQRTLFKRNNAIENRLKLDKGNTSATTKSVSETVLTYRVIVFKDLQANIDSYIDSIKNRVDIFVENNKNSSDFKTKFDNFKQQIVSDYESTIVEYKQRVIDSYSSVIENLNEKLKLSTEISSEYENLLSQRDDLISKRESIINEIDSYVKGKVNSIINSVNIESVQDITHELHDDVSSNETLSVFENISKDLELFMNKVKTECQEFIKNASLKIENINEFKLKQKALFEQKIEDLKQKLNVLSKENLSKKYQEQFNQMIENARKTFNESMNNLSESTKAFISNATANFETTIDTVANIRNSIRNAFNNMNPNSTVNKFASKISELSKTLTELNVKEMLDLYVKSLETTSDIKVTEDLLETLDSKLTDLQKQKLVNTFEEIGTFVNHYGIEGENLNKFYSSITMDEKPSKVIRHEINAERIAKLKEGKSVVKNLAIGSIVPFTSNPTTIILYDQMYKYVKIRKQTGIATERTLLGKMLESKLGKYVDSKIESMKDGTQVINVDSINEVTGEPIKVNIPTKLIKEIITDSSKLYNKLFASLRTPNMTNDAIISGINKYLEFSKANNIEVEINKNVKLYVETYKTALENNKIILNEKDVLLNGSSPFVISKEISEIRLKSDSFKVFIELIQGNNELGFTLQNKDLLFDISKYLNDQTIINEFSTNENFNKINDLVSKIDMNQMNGHYIYNIEDVLNGKEPVYMTSVLNINRYQSVETQDLISYLNGNTKLLFNNKELSIAINKFMDYVKTNNIVLDSKLYEVLKDFKNIDKNSIVINANEVFEGKKAIVLPKQIKINNYQRINTVEFVEILEDKYTLAGILNGKWFHPVTDRVSNMYDAVDALTSLSPEMASRFSDIKEFMSNVENNYVVFDEVNKNYVILSNEIKPGQVLVNFEEMQNNPNIKPVILPETISDVSSTLAYKYLGDIDLLNDLLNNPNPNINKYKLISALKNIIILQNHLGISFDNKVVNFVNNFYSQNIQKILLETVEETLPNTYSAFIKKHDKFRNLKTTIKFMKKDGFTPLDITEALLSYSSVIIDYEQSRRYYNYAYEYLCENGYSKKDAADKLGSIYDDLINKRGFDKVVVENGMTIDIQKGINWNNQPYTINYIKEYKSNMKKLYNKDIHVEFKLYDTFNSWDKYWEIEYDSVNFKSAATAGGGVINIYHTLKINDTVLSHEYAHLIDQQIMSDYGLSERFANTSEWNDAIEKDNNYPSDYAKTNSVEDFAESVSHFYSNPKQFSKLYPNRYRVLSKYINTNMVINVNSNVYSMQTVMDTLIHKYGKTEALNRIKQYLATNNINIITRDGNARYLISQLNKNEIFDYINENYDTSSISYPFEASISENSRPINKNSSEISNEIEKDVEISLGIERDILDKSKNNLKNNYLGIATNTLTDFMKLNVDAIGKILFENNTYGNIKSKELLKALVKYYEESIVNGIQLDINDNLKNLLDKLSFVDIKSGDIVLNLKNAFYTQEDIVVLEKDILTSFGETIKTLDLLKILRGNLDLKNTNYSQYSIFEATMEIVKQFENKNFALHKKVKNIFDLVKTIDSNKIIINFEDVLNGLSPTIIEDTIIIVDGKEISLKSLIYNNNYVLYDGCVLPKTFNNIDSSVITNIVQNPTNIGKYSIEERMKIIDAYNEFVEILVKQTNDSNRYQQEIKRLESLKKLNSRSIPNVKLLTDTYSFLYDVFFNNKQSGGAFGANQGVIRNILNKTGVTKAFNILFEDKLSDESFLDDLGKITREEFRNALDRVKREGNFNAVSKTVDFLKNSDVINLVRKNYPGMTSSEAIRFLYLVETREGGLRGICNYAAAVNMVFSNYIGKEAQFQSDFGYPMYTINEKGNKVLNDTMLLVDMYSLINKDVLVKEVNGMYEIAPNNSNYLNLSDMGKVRMEYFKKFLDAKGIDLSLEETFIYNSLENALWKEELIIKIKECIENGEYINVSAAGFDLLYRDTNKIAKKDCSAHIMTLVGLTQDGNLIVDSWGKELIIDLNRTFEHMGEQLDVGKRRLCIASYKLGTNSNSTINTNSTSTNMTTTQDLEIFDLPKDIDMIDESSVREGSREDILSAFASLDTQNEMVNSKEGTISNTKKQVNLSEKISNIFKGNNADLSMYEETLSKGDISNLSIDEISRLSDLIKKGKIKLKDYNLNSESIAKIIDKVPLQKIYPFSNVKAVKSFIDYFGIDTLVEFDKQNNSFLLGNKGENLYRLYDYYDLSIPKTNESNKFSELENLIINAINSNKKTEYKTYTFNYSDLIDTKFSVTYPELFLDESAPQDLKDAFYNGEVNSGNEYNSKWSKYLEGKSVKGVIHESVIRISDTSIVEDINTIGENSAKYKDGLENLANRVGLSIEEVQTILSEKLNDLIQNSEFAIRRTSSSLLQILESGKLKNQFEVNSSSFGVFNPDMRIEMEKDLFGIPRNIKYQDRPIYGMLLPKKLDSKYVTKGPGSYYSSGDGVIYIFDKTKIMNSATLTLGDSLDQAGKVSATSLSNPKYFGMFNELLSTIKTREDLDNFDFTSLYEKSVMEVGTSAYYEFQLHGEESHTLDNLKEIVFMKMPDANIIEKLNEKNISWRLYTEESKVSDSTVKTIKEDVLPKNNAQLRESAKSSAQKISYILKNNAKIKNELSPLIQRYQTKFIEKFLVDWSYRNSIQTYDVNKHDKINTKIKIYNQKGIYSLVENIRQEISKDKVNFVEIDKNLKEIDKRIKGTISEIKALEKLTKSNNLTVEEIKKINSLRESLGINENDDIRQIGQILNINSINLVLRDDIHFMKQFDNFITACKKDIGELNDSFFADLLEICFDIKDEYVKLMEQVSDDVKIIYENKINTLNSIIKNMEFYKSEFLELDNNEKKVKYSAHINDIKMDIKAIEDILNINDVSSLMLTEEEIKTQVQNAYESYIDSYSNNKIEIQNKLRLEYGDEIAGRTIAKLERSLLISIDELLKTHEISKSLIVKVSNDEILDKIKEKTKKLDLLMKLLKDSSLLGNITVVIRDTKCPESYMSKMSSNDASWYSFSMKESSNIIEIWGYENITSDNLIRTFGRLLFNRIVQKEGVLIGDSSENKLKFVNEWTDAIINDKTLSITDDGRPSHDSFIFSIEGKKGIDFDFADTLLAYTKNPDAFKGFYHNEVIQPNPIATRRDILERYFDLNGYSMHETEELRHYYAKTDILDLQKMEYIDIYDSTLKMVSNDYSMEYYVHHFYEGSSRLYKNAIYGRHDFYNAYTLIHNRPIHVELHSSFERLLNLEYGANDPKTCIVDTSYDDILAYQNSRNLTRIESIVKPSQKINFVLGTNGLWYKEIISSYRVIDSSGKLGVKNYIDGVISVYPITDIGEIKGLFKDVKTTIPIPVNINDNYISVNLTVDGVLSSEIVNYGPRLIETVNSLVNNNVNINSININELRFNQASQSFDIVIIKDDVEIIIPNSVIVNKNTGHHVLEYIDEIKNGIITIKSNSTITENIILEYYN